MGLSVGNLGTVVAGGDVLRQPRVQVVLALVVQERLKVGAGLGAGAVRVLLDRRLPSLGPA